MNMITLGVAGVALLVILYWYIKTQALRRDVANYRRQVNILSSDIKQMTTITESLAFEQQVLFRKSITQAKQLGHAENDLLKYSGIMTDALLSVTSESAIGHKNVTEAFKNYLSHTTDVSYNDFNQFMSDQSGKVKTHWHKKTVVDYFIVCRLLIESLNGTSADES